LMPLKLEVWIATIFTILIALLTIQIINRLSQRVQNFVFGRNVTTPTLNIMTAFVGSAQFVLPGKSFARFLLLLFILFSLIIRTCHQSKLFTYLQADIITKRSEIQSIDELIEQNGIIYIPDSLPVSFTAFEKFGKAVKYDHNSYKKFIGKTIDSEFDGAILVEEILLTAIKSQYKSGATSLKVLKQSELGSFIQFPHDKVDDSFREQINDVIGRMHSAGLINYWYERIFRYQEKPKVEDFDPKQLSMDHLKAGLVVSLSSLCCREIQVTILLNILVVLHSVGSQLRSVCF